MSPEPRDPARVRADVDAIFDHIERYQTFGELFKALLEASGASMKEIYRQTNVSTNAMRNWRDDETLPLKNGLDAILEKNFLHFRTDPDGGVDRAQRHLFMRAAFLEMTPDDVRQAVKKVIRREAQYPDFPKFMTALFIANNRMTDEEAAGKLDVSPTHMEHLRTGTRTVSRGLIDRILDGENNPFNLPLAHRQGGIAVVEPYAASLFWRKANIREIKPEEVRREAIDKLMRGGYKHAADFFKDVLDYLPKDEVARRMVEVMPDMPGAAAVNRDRVSLLLNGFRTITAREGNGLLMVAKIADNSPEEEVIKGLSFLQKKPAQEQAKLLRTMMLDFEHSDFTFYDTLRLPDPPDPRRDFPEVFKPPHGIEVGDVYMRAKTMAPEGEEPVSLDTIKTLLTKQAPQHPYIRTVRYVAKVLDQGAPKEQVDEWIGLNGYSREELFRTPHDIIAHLERFADMPAVMKALRSTEEINFDTRKMAEVVGTHPSSYTQYEQKHLTTEAVEKFLKEAAETMAARKFPPLTDAERERVLDRAHGELDNKVRKTSGPMQARYVDRERTGRPVRGN